jgi:hypothetical protein
VAGGSHLFLASHRSFGAFYLFLSAAGFPKEMSAAPVLPRMLGYLLLVLISRNVRKHNFSIAGSIFSRTSLT